jgi:tetrahydromethanopterin S-methyltransferase subunit B
MSTNDELIILVKEIYNKVDNIEKKIDALERRMNEEMVPECKKMGTHIDFIENVYETVRYPLGYFCNKIRTIVGQENQQVLMPIKHVD